MALKSIKTVRVLPDSPGWYWFRTSSSLWQPVSCSLVNGVLMGTFQDGDPKLDPIKGGGRLGSQPIVFQAVADVDGEWGDEINLPKQARASLSVQEGSVTLSNEPRQRSNYQPPPNQQMDEGKFDKFLYWITERHNIYMNREALGKPKPWTSDPILQSNFFCNPFRELDKTTVWFRNKLRDPLFDFPEVVMATIIFRWFNYIPTGEVLLGAATGFKSKKKVPDLGLFTHWNTEKALSLLSKQKQIFTPAHVVASGTGIAKLDSIAGTLGKMWEERIHIAAVLGGMDEHPEWEVDSMQKAHKYLMSFPSIGPFFAYEIVSDLRHTAIGRNWPDINTWANAGPGAMRGLNRLYNRPISFARPTYDWNSEMVNLYKATVARLEDSLLKWKNRRPITKEGVLFELREIEHSLCEFDKYMRLVEPTSAEDYRPGDVPKQTKRKFKGV
jgi:hypothetical protein